MAGADPVVLYCSGSEVQFNPLNAKLNPICHLLEMLAAHPILHVSRIKVNTLIFVSKMHIIFRIYWQDVLDTL
jgi:hypothetical protein